MMTPLLLEKFAALRTRLFAAISEALKLDSHCKSYEGQFHVIWPHFHQSRGSRQYDAHRWCIRLDCYVIGPSRHYEWFGDTFVKALAKCEADVDQWIAEAAQDRADG